MNLLLILCPLGGRCDSEQRLRRRSTHAQRERELGPGQEAEQEQKRTFRLFRALRK